MKRAVKVQSLFHAGAGGEGWQSPTLCLKCVILENVIKMDLKSKHISSEVIHNDY